MNVQRYTLTLENSTTVTIELEHCGGTLWRHEILHGTPPFHYAFYHTFGECLRVACLRVEERYGSPVVQCDRMFPLPVAEDQTFTEAELSYAQLRAAVAERLGELEAIVRAVAEMDPFCRDGDCVPCREWLGSAT
ncbi:MAG TPA: hypothetical protein VNN25_27045, partial [Thermoanaerobaculia bacterium]|nr:hypothetical protein [Thermoanaerobaculia bacterium]